MKRIRCGEESVQVGKALPIIGYITAILGGWLGIVIGIYIANTKIVDSSGEKIYKYDQPSRNRGYLIIVLSFVGIVTGRMLAELIAAT